jgi:uncharacterized protein with NAD-binding domain and iron-sulfur cluster
MREWLAAHGANGDSITAAPIQAMYDLAFAYPEGMTPSLGGQGELAASVALRIIVGLVCYPYPGMWTMRWGMGDTVFAPLYEVLKKRGVTFKFFHRVKALHLSEDGRRIDGVDVVRQATLKSGRDDDYHPLSRVKGIKSWPSAPRWDQLVDGDGLRRRRADFESAWYTDSGETLSLKCGDDFDKVILGISVHALREICSELCSAPTSAGARWKHMLAALQTVRTQALQLWLAPTLRELGYGGKPPVLGGLGEPMSTWADMTSLLAAEDWAPDETPRCIAYFCGVMPDDPAQAPFGDNAYPVTQTALAMEASAHFVREALGTVWPDEEPRASVEKALKAAAKGNHPHADVD